MANNSNNEVIMNENLDLGWEELNELESRARAENMKRTTTWGLTKFEKWCDN